MNHPNTVTWGDYARAVENYEAQRDKNDALAAEVERLRREWESLLVYAQGFPEGESPWDSIVDRCQRALALCTGDYCDGCAKCVGAWGE